MGITQAQGQKIKTIVKEQEQPLFNVSKRIINWLKKSEVHLGGILSLSYLHTGWLSFISSGVVIEFFSFYITVRLSLVTSLVLWNC